MTAPRHVDVGAYLLGILDEPDEVAYEQHFAQCEQCRREFIELADMPAFLDMVKPAEQGADLPSLPPLDSLIDFKQLKPPGQQQPSPAVPPQQRPAGATQPNKVPPTAPTNGKAVPRTNGTARPTGTGHHVPAPPKPGEHPRAEGTGRHAPVDRPRAEGTGRHKPATRSQAEGTGQHTPATRSRAEKTGQHTPVSRAESTAPIPRTENTGQHKPATRSQAESGGRTAPAPRAESTGQHTPATRSQAQGTGQHPPATRSQAQGTGQQPPATRSQAQSTGQQPPATRSRAESTGQHAPATRSQAESTGRHTPASSNAGARPAPADRTRAESTGRSAPVVPRGDGTTRPPATRPSPAKSPTKPPSKPRDPGPANRGGGRRTRKPVWLATLAFVAVALSVGTVIGLTSGDSGSNDNVADRNTTAPSVPPSGAVAGAHVVSGTDPDSGVTAIITIEPVTGGTEIDLALYEIDGPQEGVLIAVSRFGDRESIVNWKAPEGRAGRAEAVRGAGVASFAQQDIIRFEVHGDGIEPLLVVPT
jgi:hypothetical protein